MRKIPLHYGAIIPLLIFVLLLCGRIFDLNIGTASTLYCRSAIIIIIIIIKIIIIIIIIIIIASAISMLIPTVLL